MLTDAEITTFACSIPGSLNYIIYAGLNADLKLPLSEGMYWTLYTGWKIVIYLVIALLKPWILKENAKIL